MESTQFADGVYTGVKEGVEKDPNVCNLGNWMNADAMCRDKEHPEYPSVLCMTVFHSSSSPHFLVQCMIEK